MNKFIYIVFFINTFLIQAQSSYTGEILTSTNKGIAYAKIIVKGTEYGTYSDLNGKFIMKEITQKDTLEITATGYNKKIITNLQLDLPVNFFLEPDDSEILEDIIITAYDLKNQHWINYFDNKSNKFKNKYYRDPYYAIQTLFKGSANINQFTAIDTLRIKGFSVYTGDNRKKNVILQPIILLNDSDLNDNLVKGDIKSFAIGENKSEKITKLEFDFKNVITFYPGEQVKIGVELINSDFEYNSENVLFLPLLCYKKETIAISSFRKEILKENRSDKFNTCNTFYERPFYFELRVIK